ncbi:ABC-2 transporter permease [Heyndrickxia sp. NPDC080065]|uniref:ABC-2 transporter permease n=1 Tax=Heyndrickxia sp. NPDC080065 TaxID=3390568 RepID=UPI003D02F887
MKLNKLNVLGWVLPYTRKEIVSSKYIETLLITIAVTPFCLVGNYFIVDSMKFQFSLKNLVITFGVVMMVAAFYLPFFYKFKAQYLLFVSILLSTGIMFLMRNIPYILNKYDNDFFVFLKGISELQLYGILAVIAVSFYGLSWMLSIRIYKNKAF